MSEEKRYPLVPYQPTVVDLFSGAGGTGLGFRRAGFRILGAIEKDPNAVETYKRNLGVYVFPSRIEHVIPTAYRVSLGLLPRELHVMVGCPPCQGFTRLRNGDGATDKRNGLVLTYLSYVREFLPRFAVFENVPGIIRMPHGKEFYDGLCNGLRKLGYRVIELEEDAADYGAPQHRRRVVVLAGRDGEEPPKPERTHGDPQSEDVLSGRQKRWVTVRDAISCYPKLEVGENGERAGKYPNHIAPKTGERVLSFIKRVPHDGGSRSEVPKEFWLNCHKTHNGHTDVYGRLSWDEPAGTLTSGCTNPSKGRFVHPNQDRALTPREAAKLQGFPDTYVFYGYYVAEQIGNAVPPPLAFSIARALAAQLLQSSPSS